MFNMTKVEIELIPYPDKYILFEKGTRVGASYIPNRHSIANNKCLKSSFNLFQPTTSFLPTSGFRWINAKEFDLNQYT